MPVCQFQHFPKASKLYAIEILPSNESFHYNDALDFFIYGRKMSQIISTETPGSKRNSIFKLIVNLMPAIQSSETNLDERNDIVAFIVLSLLEVEKSINATLKPWEKRGYWSKADQFRMEWAWIEKVKNDIQKEESVKGWKEWPRALADLYVHLAEVKPTRKKMGKFWQGSFELYKKQK